MYRLNAKGLVSAKAGKHQDGGGLQLVKREDGGAQWVLRVTVHGRRREMGLGRYPDVGLAEARRLAEGARAIVRDGADPIRHREKMKREAVRNLHLLKDVASDCFEARKASLKGDGVNGRWFSPLEIHVLPKLGNTPVAEIDQAAIRDVMKPIWHAKAKTAEKALQRLAIVMTHAAALGLDVDLQACVKAKALLGAQNHTVEHIDAIAWANVPAFYKSLGNTTGELALKLLILTGVRSAPLRFMHESHIDGDIWTIPAALMKGGRNKTDDFRVPLTPEALAVIGEARTASRDGLLFVGHKGKQISDMAMSMVMRRRKFDARPHGFRSSLRDWLAEATDAPHEVAEAVLAHVTDGKVVRSYRRTDFLDQRRALLERWAVHVTGKPAKPAEEQEVAAETRSLVERRQEAA